MGSFAYENVYHDDALLALRKFKENSIDLVITSPPYASKRTKIYSGVSEKDYVKWFIPIAQEIERVLSPTGSFFLNIKPHVVDGERSLYVFDLIRAIKDSTDLLFIEEYCWVKNGFPGDLKGRFKNSFEPVYHFTKSKPNKIKFNPLACGTPIKAETLARAKRKQCGAPKNGSGMVAVSTNNLSKLTTARPSNVIYANNILNQHSDRKDHGAVFPESLVEFFVKSFSDEGDIVLDCFAGSGTVGDVCLKNNRKFVLIDNSYTYFMRLFNRFSLIFKP